MQCHARERARARARKRGRAAPGSTHARGALEVRVRHEVLDRVDDLLEERACLGCVRGAGGASVERGSWRAPARQLMQLTWKAGRQPGSAVREERGEHLSMRCGNVNYAPVSNFASNMVTAAAGGRAGARDSERAGAFYSLNLKLTSSNGLGVSWHRRPCPARPPARRRCVRYISAPHDRSPHPRHFNRVLFLVPLKMAS